MKEIQYISPKAVIGSLYFVYFGVLGIYLPYFNLYCYSIGFSGFQIGALSALRSVALILFPLIWGKIADRWGVRKAAFVLCSFSSAAVWSGYLMTADFPTMLGLTLLYGVFYAPLISFTETFSMEVLSGDKRNYGALRVWGSISFILAVMAVGKAVEHRPMDLVLALILIGSLFQAILSVNVPPDDGNRPPAGAGQASFSVFRGRTALFLFCAFLMLLSHGAYYGFFSIHLETMGYKGTFIGASWALATLSEISVMMNSRRIFNRFSLESVLVFSMAVAGLRWAVLFLAVSPVAILASQLLHAVTYGTFHIASILYIDRLTPAHAKGFGQAVNNATTYGLGLMAGFFLNGVLYARIGSSGLFGVSGIIAVLGTALMQLCLRAEAGAEKKSSPS